MTRIAKESKLSCARKRCRRKAEYYEPHTENLICAYHFFTSMAKKNDGDYGEYGEKNEDEM